MKGPKLLELKENTTTEARPPSEPDYEVVIEYFPSGQEEMRVGFIGRLKGFLGLEKQ